MSPRLLLIVFLMVAAARCLAQATAEPRPLDLPSALQLALQQNFSLRTESVNPRLAAEAVREAKGVLDPTLRSESTYSWAESELSPQDAQSVTTSVSLGSRLPWSTRWSIVAKTTESRDPADFLPDSIGERAQSSLRFTVVQPLWRDAGRDNTMAEIQSARARLHAARHRFAEEVRSVVQQTVDAYTDLHFAMRLLTVAERNRDLAAQLLEDNRKRVQKGVMAPADALKAEAELALRMAPVHEARYQVHFARNRLVQLLWDDPESVYEADFQLAEPAFPDNPPTDRARDLARALRTLPALHAAEAELQARQIELRRLHNQSRPRLDLVASVASGGHSSHSFGSSFAHAAEGQQSGYSIGAVFSLPVLNHARKARRSSAFLQRNRAELALRQLRQSVRINLDNAIARLQSASRQRQASARARSLIERSLNAEEERLAAGASSTFVVLRLQADLADARVRELNAAAGFAKAYSAYLRASAQLLPTFRIHLPRSP